MRRRLVTVLLPLALVASALAWASPLAAGSATAGKGCPGADADPSEISLAKIREATRCLLNARRAARGKAKLKENGKLKRAATRHSRAMARRNFFSHASPGGDDLVDRVKRAGYLSGSSSWALAENIAWGSGPYATPRSIVNGWMHSSGHRENILSRRFEHVGVGVARGAPVGGSSGGATYTTDFGQR
jgi:uncharacterized protein YkwD